MERSLKNRRALYILLVFAIVQIALAGLSSQLSFRYYSRIILLTEINILLTVSLALINGFTGQFSLGHAGFMAIGAYASVGITTILPRAVAGEAMSVATFPGHLGFVAAIVFGGFCAAGFGFLIGFPTLRLKGDYLAIVTLAGGEMIRALLRLFEFVGGPRGVPGIPKFTDALYLGAFFVAALWVMRNFVYSHHGRACIAVRENEIAAESVGVNSTYQKVSAFVLGAFFAGIAGALFAHMSQYINPDNFGILKSLEILIFLYVGGAQTLSGGIMGAGLFTAIPELMRLANLESWRMVVYPLLLIIVMRIKPDGIMGKSEFGFLTPRKRSKRAEGETDNGPT